MYNAEEEGYIEHSILLAIVPFLIEISNNNAEAPGG
jgi:hypothetical protein